MPMGYQTSLNLKVIISIVSFKQNMNLKIQILAGKTLMTRFHVGFEIELPLAPAPKLSENSTTTYTSVLMLVPSQTNSLESAGMAV